MEYTTFSIVAISAVLSFVLAFFIKSMLLLKQFEHLPGPRPRLPVLGNVLLFYRPKLPYSQLFTAVFSDLITSHRKDGMFALFFGSKVLIYLIKAEYAADFLKENTLINKAEEYDLFRPWLGNGLITANGAIWKNKRKLLTPTFHSKILEEYIPTINDQCLRLIQKLREATKQPFIDIRPLMSEITLNIISVTAMGMSLEEESLNVVEYRECLKRLPTTISSRMYNPLYWYDFIFYRTSAGKQFKRDIETVKTLNKNVINQRKVDFKPGLNFSDSKQMAFLDLLLTLQSEDNTITDEEIEEDVANFMFAGHDTSSLCLSWTLLLLGNNAECQQKVIHEMNSIFGDDCQRCVNKDDINHMHYTECVIKESLRMFPPGAIFGRKAIDDICIGPHKIPKGTSVLINTRAVHSDENSFTNPNEFIPERFENQTHLQVGFMPFAMGPRNCIGQRFAMIELKIILAHIFRNFRVKCLDKVSDIKISSDGVLKPMSPIRVSFEKL